MKQVIAAILLVVTMPAISMATAMSPERSRCIGMEDSLERYMAWSRSFDKFKGQGSALNEATRFDLTKKALKKVIILTEDFAQRAELGAPTNLLTQAKSLISESEAGHIPQASAMKVMTSGLGKFEEKMGAMIHKAEEDNQYCFMDKRVIYTNSGTASSISAASKGVN